MRQLRVNAPASNKVEATSYKRIEREVRASVARTIHALYILAKFKATFAFVVGRKDNLCVFYDSSSEFNFRNG